jgi:DNA repair exonuclease SbcCD ATPase subunit
MPESLIECPSCGHEVPNGKYCNLCGEQLHDEGSTDISEKEESFIDNDTENVDNPEEKSLVEPISLPHFDVVIQDMPYEVSVILLSSAELVVLDDELDRIIEQTKATRQALQLQRADKAVLTARAESLREEFERAKQRRRELTSVKERLALETILEALDKHEARLSKLEGISGTLDKDVYEEQRIEILQTIKELRISLKEAIRNGKKWSKGIKNTLKALQKEKSRLDAKFKIGDISRDKYESSRMRMERGVRIIEGGQRRLDELLELTKKR